MIAIERYPMLAQLVIFLAIMSISVLGGYAVVIYDRYKKPRCLGCGKRDVPLRDFGLNHPMCEQCIRHVEAEGCD